MRQNYGKAMNLAFGNAPKNLNMLPFWHTLQPDNLVLCSSEEGRFNISQNNRNWAECRVRYAFTCIVSMTFCIGVAFAPIAIFAKASLSSFMFISVFVVLSEQSLCFEPLVSCITQTRFYPFGIALVTKYEFCKPVQFKCAKTKSDGQHCVELRINDSQGREKLLLSFDRHPETLINCEKFAVRLQTEWDRMAIAKKSG